MKKHSMKQSVKPPALLQSYAWMSRQNVMPLLLRLTITGHQLMSGKCKLSLALVTIAVLFLIVF